MKNELLIDFLCQDVNKLKHVTLLDNCSFSDVIFSDERSVMIERSTRECVLNGTRKHILDGTHSCSERVPACQKFCVPLAFLQCSVCVPITRSLLGYFCPVLYARKQNLSGEFDPPQHEALRKKKHKLCIYSPEPRAEAYCLKLNFNI